MLSAFVFVAALCQALFIRFLGQIGIGLQSRADKGHEEAFSNPPHGWPSCALVIPVSGSHDNMEKALESLLEQNYPEYQVCLVVSEPSDKAFEITQRLAAIHSNATVVLSGEASICGQKNHNLLAGINSIATEVDVFAFSDSTHIAQSDFLKCLIAPIANGEASFTTGYHQVQPVNNSIMPLAYALSVLFMRFLQGISSFTQLWGGAMAMSRQAFIQYRISDLWQTNVVDDCSLSAFLMKSGVHVRVCPAALLSTPVKEYSLPVWKAWLTRQILFLKFCIPSQWIALGFFCLFMLLPPFWCLLSILSGIFGLGEAASPFLALCWLCILGWTLSGWRNFISVSVPVTHWIWAFFSAIFMFALVYFQTLLTRSITWHKFVYEVGKNGIILKMRHK